MLNRRIRKTLSCLTLAGAMTLPLVLAACDRVESSSKTKTEKIVDTPEGKKKVTETTETTKTTEDK